MRSLLAAVVTVTGCLGQVAWGDAPVERYHVPPAKIRDSVLKAAIGILTLNSGYKAGSELACHVMKAGKLVPFGVLKSRQLVPVSSYSSPETRIESEMTNWRFPVTRRGTLKGKALVEIVVDPAGDGRVWVELAWLDKHYDVDLLLFPKGPIKHLVSPLDPKKQAFVSANRPTALDLFFLDKNPVAAYRSAKAGGAAKLVREGEEYFTLNCSGGFVEIGVPGLLGKWKSVGWVPLRDTKGRLSVWLKGSPRK